MNENVLMARRENEPGRCKCGRATRALYFEFGEAAELPRENHHTPLDQATVMLQLSTCIPFVWAPAAASAGWRDKTDETN